MKKRDYSKGCGTSMGQNESCVEGYLCDACRAAIASEARENALIAQISVLMDALEDIIRACSSGILTTGDIERIAKEALKKVQ